jgi:hypothetical protein
MTHQPTGLLPQPRKKNQMLDETIPSFEPTPRKKHRALVNPWMTIDSIKQSLWFDCDLPIDLRIEFSDRIADIVKKCYSNFITQDN